MSNPKTTAPKIEAPAFSAPVLIAAGYRDFYYGYSNAEVVAYLSMAVARDTAKPFRLVRLITGVPAEEFSLVAERKTMGEIMEILNAHDMDMG